MQHAVQKIGEATEGTLSEEMDRFLVTFNSVWEAKSIYKDRFIGLRNTKIFLSEDLTKEEAYTFFLARQLRKKQLIHTTWTENGDTFIIESQEMLPRIIQHNDPVLQKLQQDSAEQMKNDQPESSTIYKKEEIAKDNTHDENPEETDEVQNDSSDTENGLFTKTDMSKTKKRKTRKTNQFSENND